MIFKTTSNDIVRIPDNRLCGRMCGEDVYLWCAGDGDDELTYPVSRETFLSVMDKLKDKEAD